MSVIDAGLAVASLALLVPAAVFFLEVAAARRATDWDEVPEVERPRVAVLIPAHDEAAVIGECLASLAPQLEPGDRLVVIADNCTDDTAKIAASMGAEVVERRDAERRGKGYALDHGVRYLAEKRPEVVIFVDADCRVAAGSIDRLARTCALEGRPAQALYLMRHDDNSSFKARFREFAWIVKNQVRPLGLHAFGLPCQLMGTGMAFPWPLIARAPLASANLVEDLALGLDLACRGAAPVFCPRAWVASRFPQSQAAAATQRTRWEHGHLALLFKRAPKLLVEAARKRDPDLLALALDLCVPPLALLTLLLSALLIVNALIGAQVALPISAAAAIFVAVAVVRAWFRYGRHLLSPLDLALAPLHVLPKLAFYFRFLVRRETAWVRSARDAEEERKHA